ncbi:hypothetical protein H5410_040241 [Solanum commersonii]|uniref:Uncharacterized protein n=1 Tax=Solanum commersonii TaxID=4109 RepID=A0A9J5XQE7_SOLCO|nr:hypothetical protein H5410_040241 [Solanum commersonii]
MVGTISRRLGDGRCNSSLMGNVLLIVYLYVFFVAQHGGEVMFEEDSFFCAIEPEMRSRWASKIRDLLKPDGELITLIFPVCQ